MVAKPPCHQRWTRHIDGGYIGFEDVDVSKFITVIKGPGTLAIKQTKELDEIYYKIQDAEFSKVDKLKGKKKLTDKENMNIYIKVNDEFRPKYAKAFSKFKVLQPKKNKVLVFYTRTTMHSEPKTDVPRLFISIMPGSKANIEGMDKPLNII